MATKKKETIRPILLPKVGRVRAKIWPNKAKNGSTYYTFDPFRTYKVSDQAKLTGKGDQGFRDTHLFSVQDIPSLIQQLQNVAAAIEQEQASETQNEAA